MYVARGIEGRLVEAVTARPVVVLEGARAVGKSTMCDELVRRGHLAVRASLTDPAVRDFAARDLRGWLGSLRTPAVIDEAQLIAELPLAVKDLVDRRGTPAQFVLTGSASIGRTGLGGSDPLAGRAVRLCLRPLTQIELRDPLSPGDGRAELSSVVDSLFDHTPNLRAALPTIEREQLARRMTRGGFPLQALGAGAARSARLHREQVETDVEAVLTEVHIGDEQFDVFRAHRLLDSVASVPSGILNVTKLAGELGVARQTIDTYLGHLQRRFLIHRLANFGARPRAQGVGTARPKVHPVDTALSIAILNRMGQQFRSNAELFGALLESFVVNELIAQAAWSQTQPEAGYWRDTGRRGDAEVDLVLVDGTGRSVGVEVKSSATARIRDADGLLAMRSTRGLHRGFVVYQGAEIVEIAESIWALPLTALTDTDVWDRPRALPPTRVVEGSDSLTTGTATPARVTPPVASLFVTYVHADDLHENGAIRNLVARLTETYEFLFGEQLEIFIDHDIRWGESWEARIAAELERTTFLLAIVTPRFLLSAQCRDEVLQFATAARRLGQPRLVLPLIWRRPAQLAETTGDLVVERLREAQWEDIGDLRFDDPTSPPYRRRLEELAERLHETIDAMDARPPSSVGPAAADDETDEPDLIELSARAEDAAAGVGHGFVELIGALQRVGADLGTLGTPGTSGSQAAPQVIRAWATRAGEVMAPSATVLQDAVSDMRRGWSELDEAMVGIVRLAAGFPSAQRPQTMQEFFEQVENLHDMFDQVLGSPDIIEFGDTLRGVAAASRRLRPVVRAVEAALALLAEMRTTTATWLRMRDVSAPG